MEQPLGFRARLGDEGTVSYTPAITVWDEAGTSWSTETTAHWAYTETHTGTAYSADTTETWGFVVGPAEAIGAWTGAPLTLTWSSSNTAYGNGWLFVGGTVTWIGADGVVAFGSTTTQIVRD